MKLASVCIPLLLALLVTGCEQSPKSGGTSQAPPPGATAAASKIKLSIDGAEPISELPPAKWTVGLCCFAV